MMDAEEPLYLCLNYCIQDQDTGHCLTCGRPPIPVTPFNPQSFSGLSLLNKIVFKNEEKTPDKKEDGC